MKKHLFKGLPDNYNISEFDKVVSNSHNLDMEPMTLLSALMQGEEDVSNTSNISVFG